MSDDDAQGTPQHGGTPSGGSPYDKPSSPYGGPPPAGPPPGGGSPYDPPPSHPGGGGPYGGAPYGGAPYGAPQDPRLAGMPPLGGLGNRVVARIIDYLIISVPVSILAAIFSGFDDYEDTGTYGWSLFALLAYFVYEGVMLSKSGQTVGKKVMGIRVAMLQDGAVPTGGPAWIRSSVYHLPLLIPCLGWFFWLFNVLSCTWDKPFRQCVHDKAAKTVVVKAVSR
ncbi:RDD family protein [Streptomyces polyrhachis]|uniref:RDD family protein n=1 Tax=Streptomyces polyrhachis TaxID=1282885 RepID=A0ABW2GEZ0_9ACTN